MCLCVVNTFAIVGANLNTTINRMHSEISKQLYHVSSYREVNVLISKVYTIFAAAESKGMTPHGIFQKLKMFYDVAATVLKIARVNKAPTQKINMIAHFVGNIRALMNGVKQRIR